MRRATDTSLCSRGCLQTPSSRHSTLSRPCRCVVAWSRNSEHAEHTHTKTHERERTHIHTCMRTHTYAHTYTTCCWPAPGDLHVVPQCRLWHRASSTTRIASRPLYCCSAGLSDRLQPCWWDGAKHRRRTRCGVCIIGMSVICSLNLPCVRGAAPVAVDAAHSLAGRCRKSAYVLSTLSVSLPGTSLPQCAPAIFALQRLLLARA